MKTRFLSLFLIILIGTLVSCTAQPTPEYIPEGAERDLILADSDVFIQDIVDGIKDKDYATFSKDFDDVMLASLKPGDFDKLSATYSLLGAPSTIELVNVQVAGEYFAVRYKVTYPEKVLTMRVVVDNSDPRKVSGLWFD
jgi:hypothetical protein